jgi:hypothetical protein
MREAAASRGIMPARDESAGTPRLLGTIGMLCAPMLLLESLYRIAAQLPDNQNNRLVGVLGTLYIAGWMASTVGMRRLRVTGRGFWSRLVFVIQMAGLMLALLWSVQEIFRSGTAIDNTIYAVIDMSWPLSHLFMLVVGAFVIKAGVWRGWRMIAPFLCGLALPLFFAASAAGARTFGLVIFPATVTIGFIMLGYAVRTAEDSTAA